ncbi:MAG: hypothetical protein ACD_40C00139G0001 [uncultured bacterium]|nr:MAG: hypothetical protein ACD_40C00139G0001 [uncultured bacterium]
MTKSNTTSPLLSNKPGLYKHFISPFLHALLAPQTGTISACRFTPTCSQYFHQSVLKYGIIRGSIQGLKRLSRCHPLSRGGYDPA